VLSGNNTYSGGTMVTAGTLYVGQNSNTSVLVRLPPEWGYFGAVAVFSYGKTTSCA
jgi:hypothetical protein